MPQDWYAAIKYVGNICVQFKYRVDNYNIGHLLAPMKDYVDNICCKKIGGMSTFAQNFDQVGISCISNASVSKCNVCDSYSIGV